MKLSKKARVWTKKALDIWVILMMLLQPVSMPGVMVAIAQDATSAEVVESTPADSVQTQPAEVVAPVVEKAEPAVAPTPVVEPTPAPVEPVVTPTEQPAPAEPAVAETPTLSQQPASGAVDQQAVSTEKPAEIWSKDGDKATTNEAVELERTYVAPQNDQVSVIFTKLPEKAGKLSIEEITLSDEQVALLGALSNKAYDITSDMADGSFEYTMTLPTKDNADPKKVNIVYVENVSELSDASKIKTVDEKENAVSVDSNKDEVKIEALDHFTIYIATYSDMSLSIGKTNFAKGETVHLKTTSSLTASKYYRVDAVEPNGTTRHSALACANSVTFLGSYSIPAVGPTGKWNMEIEEFSDSVNCNNRSSRNDSGTVSFNVVPVDVRNVSSDTFGLTSVTGVWTNTTGGSYINGLNSNEVRWGNGDNGQSGLRFDGANVETFNDNGKFYLGTLTHFNYPINNAASGAKLKITMNFSKPTGVTSPDFSYDFAIEETSNTKHLEDCNSGFQQSQTPCDDRITFPSSYGTTSVQIGDKLYTLKIEGFTKSYPNGALLPSFITEESKDNAAYLVGSLSSMLVEEPEIRLVEKAVNGQDADTEATGPNLTIGSPANFTYAVQNTGNVTMTDVAVVDSMGVKVTCPKTTLNSKESMTCTGSSPVIKGQYENFATVSGKHSGTTYTSDKEYAHYFGVSPEKKVTICHSTSSDTNPYNKIEVSINSVSKCQDVNGHGSDINDIIPIFSFDECTYPGKNLDATGQAILDNNCEVPTGTIEVKKALAPANDSGKFNLQIDGVTKKTDAGNGDTTSEITVLTGAHSVGELAGTNSVLTDYNSSISCSNGQNGTGTSLAGVNVKKDDSVVCTITNTRKTGTVTLEKIVEGGTSVPADWGFYISGISEIFKSGNSVTLNTGTYNISESGPAGYTPVSVEGACSGLNVDGKSAALTVTEDGGVCKFKNVRDTGDLKALKMVDDGADLSQWSFSLDGKTAVKADANGAVDFGQVTTLDNHTIVESGPAGYRTASISCSPQAGTPNLEAGSVATTVTKGGTTVCTFNNNVDKGSVTIIKNAIPDDPQDFAFSFGNLVSGLGNFNLDDDTDATLPNTQTFSNLFPGSYNLSEGSVAGWNLTNLSCVESGTNSLNDSSTNILTAAATLSLQPGENIVCTFTNNKKPVTISTAKVVCDSELALPNGIANAGGQVNADTASNYVAQSNGHCQLVPDWKFQWNGASSDPGNATVGEVAGWHTFTNSTEVGFDGATTSRIDVREVLPDGSYLPFSGGSDKTAEFYCTSDGVNYDNWEWLKNPAPESKYYCVAWNVKKSSDVKVCKVDQNKRPLAGWNLQFLGGKVEDVTVPTNNGVTVSSSVLPQGDYALVASGTYKYRGGTNLLSDANFSQRLEGDKLSHFKPGTLFPFWNWANVKDFKAPLEGYLGIAVNGTATNWSEYLAADNSYALGYADHSGAFGFKVADDYYGDNVGNLKVAVYKGYAGTTGEDGCVTFGNVPLGSYTVAETLKADWMNVEGLGAVNVDSDNEEFTVMNRPQPGKISVTKKALNQYGAEISDTTTNFTVKVNGVEKSVKDDGTVSFEGLEPGTYTVEEINVPATYELKNIDVDEDINTPGTQVVVLPNKTVAVTVTNWQKPYCGDGVVNENLGEQCDGASGVTNGKNFCTQTCKLIPIYDGGNACPADKPFEKLLGSYQIGSKDADGEAGIALATDVPYLFRASGVYQYSGSASSKADASYATSNGWSSVRSDVGVQGTNKGVTSVLADLGSGVGVVNWDNDSNFNADHIYAKQFTPSSNVNANFRISDWYADWYGDYCKNQSCMGDNDGASIKLDVYECVAPKDIKGTKYDYETKEVIEGWEMSACLLTDPSNSESACVETKTTITDENGQYEFEDLGPGVYKVCEGSKAGYTPISPASQCYLVDLSNDTFKVLGNVVANGGFEKPIVSGWATSMQGTAGLGWDVSWIGGSTSFDGYDRPEPASLELQRDVNGWSDYEGAQYAELDSDWGVANGEPANVKISQNLATCEGGTYQVNYAWSPRPGVSRNEMKVSIAGDDKKTHSASGGGNTSWHPELFSFVASGANTELAFRETGAADSLGMFLDGVTVTQTGACSLGLIDFYNREDLQDAQIKVEKSGPTYVPAGQPINYSYAVTNPGAVPLSNVSVSDDKCLTVTYDSGDSNGNAKLDVGENWKYSCVAKLDWVLNKKLTNTANAEGHYRSQVAHDQDSFTLQSFILRKDVRISADEDFSDPDTSFNVNITKGESVLGSMTISENAPAQMWLADSGSYDFCEVNVPSEYTTHYPEGCLTYHAGENNYPDWTQINYVKPVTIVAQKIVCDREEDLPNWGQNGGPDITATTASAWLENHPGCQLTEGWNFQWSLDGAGNPGDNVETAGTGWNALGTTDSNGSVSANIYKPDTTRLWMRESLKPNYLPFTYGSGGNENNISAEFYCGSDVLNYDNWEWIDTRPGETYHCVAWNVLNYGNIEVTKYYDEDRDGIMDENEKALSDWKINLAGDQQNERSSSFLQEQVTDENGKAMFDYLLGGPYILSEDLKEGWEQTNISCESDNDREDNGDAKFFEEENILDKDNNHQITLNYGENMKCYIGNHELGELELKKTNDSLGLKKKPGEKVKYTLEITASKGKVFGVTVTDLPPTGFTYISGSAVGAPFIHEYASPGVWDLGTMAPGEVKILTYETTIDGEQDPGLYNDTAFAKGTTEIATEVLANEAVAEGPFVGTEVEVITPADPIKITLRQKVDTDTKIKKKYVLGAELPATGSETIWTLLGLGMMTLGTLLLILKRKNMLRKSNTLAIVFGIALVGLLTGGNQAKAETPAVDPRISVRIEQPKTPSSESAFQIGFVALDTEGRDLDLQCYQVASPDVEVETIFSATTLGGNSGRCNVNLANGTYEFYVVAKSGADYNSSAKVSVEIDSRTPGIPLNYDRDGDTCNVYFKTANDSLTAKVELYRSKDREFVADASTLVNSVDIAPNTEGMISDPNANCDDYLYAIRAVSGIGAVSGFVGDKDIKVKNETETKTIVLPNETAGAIPVTGNLQGGGEVASEQTAGQEQAGQNEGQNGSVLGEETSTSEKLSDLLKKDWPWILLLLIIVAGIAWRIVEKRKKNDQEVK